jgi:hypothetical protein
LSTWASQSDQGLLLTKSAGACFNIRSHELDKRIKLPSLLLDASLG